MRPVSLGNAPTDQGAAFQWVLDALKEIEKASNDILANDTSSSGAAMATVHGAAADEMVFFTSETETDFTTITAFARTLLDDTSASGMLTTLGAVPATRQIVSGGGLTGGGALSADLTLAVGAGTGITVNADDVALTVPVTTALGGTGSTTVAGARANLSVAFTTQTEYISGIISAPANKDYRIVERLPYACVVQRGTVKTASGTCTATFKINTTAITNLALGASSSVATSTTSSNNSAAAADTFVLTVSSNSAAVDLSFTLEYTRTLATS